MRGLSNQSPYLFFIPGTYVLRGIEIEYYSQTMYIYSPALAALRARVDPKIAPAHRRKSSEWSRTYLRAFPGKSNRRLQLTRAHRTVDRTKQIFFYGFQGGNSFPAKRARRLTLHSGARDDSFLPNTNGFAESFGQIELQKN